jgi:hypothetical protein
MRRAARWLRKRAIYVGGGVILLVVVGVAAASGDDGGDPAPVQATVADLRPAMAPPPPVEEHPPAPPPPSPPIEPHAATPLPAPTTCTFTVSSNVRGAEVWFGNRPRGFAGEKLTGPCGPTTILLRHDGYNPHSQLVEVVPDGRFTIGLTVAKTQVPVTVESEPAGADVTSDTGKKLGKTPFVTTVNRDEQLTLRFSAPGMASDWRRIWPKQATTVHIALHPK